jgi:hypothetical protein
MRSFIPTRLLFLPVAAGLVAGCGPSEEEIQKLMDARVGSLQQRLEAEKVIKTDDELEKLKSEEAAKTEWERSGDFLASLDKLMDGYSPPLPEVKDDTDVLGCVSEAGMAEDPGLAAASRVLLADLEGARRARDAAARALEGRRWLQYSLDYDWERRVATKEEKAPVRHLDAFGLGDYDFAGQYLYSGTTTPEKPEVMKRMEAESLTVPERFWCKVKQQIVLKEAGVSYLVCDGEVESVLQFLIDVLSVRNVGDVVSVPLRDSKGWFVEGLLRKPAGNETRDRFSGLWHVDSLNDPKLETPAECPSDETIALKALEKVNSPRDAAPLLALLRGSPPVTDDGKRKVADDDLRNKRYADAGTAYQALGDADGMAAAARGLADANDVAGAVTLL